MEHRWLIPRSMLEEGLLTQLKRLANELGLGTYALR